jgi:uncharacterized protein (TIGR02246 family)
LVVLASACAPRPAFTRGDRRIIRAALDDQRDAWNRGDLEAFMAAYERSGALVFTSGGAIRRGWHTTFAKYRERYGDDPSSMGTLEFVILQIRPVGADAAVVLGTWRVTRSPQSGHGVFSLVFARTPRGWRIIHDHTSAAPPPETP